MEDGAANGVQKMPDHRPVPVTAGDQNKGDVVSLVVT